MPVDLYGTQEATTRSLPDGTPDDSGVKLARAIGMDLDPWQAEILSESARTDHNGRWSAFENVAIVPRQNGKSFLIIARALAGILVYGEKLILYSAHEYRTAQEVWRTMRDVCESDVLSPFVSRIRVRSGGEQVEFTNGARFRLIARTRTSGRGFSPDCLLFDEAFALSEEVTASTIPSLSARPNPQVYYLSSASTWEALVLLKLRQRGHSKVSPRFAYWEWHADATEDHRDPRLWARVNPGYGYRLTEHSIQRELESMSVKSFQRERLGVWSESAVEAVLSEEDINNLAVDDPRPERGARIGWGVDVAGNEGRTGAAIAAAFIADDGLPVVTLVETRPGAGWLPERLGWLTSSYGADPVAYDARGGITDLMERADREHDVAGMPLKYGQYPAACAAFVQRVTEGAIHIGRSPALIGDCVSAIARQLTGGWVWDRRTATPPTALIAASCALYALEHNEGSVAIY